MTYQNKSFNTYGALLLCALPAPLFGEIFELLCIILSSLLKPQKCIEKWEKIVGKWKFNFEVY